MRKPKQARTIKLLDNDTCPNGHDIRDKDKSLHLYTNYKNNKVALLCKQCHSERSQRYYATHSQSFGMSKAERSKVRAENNAKIAERYEQRRRQQQATNELRREIILEIKKLNHAELLELLDTLTK